MRSLRERVCAHERIVGYQHGDRHMCGCGVMDGQVCGMQTRMPRHGMKDGWVHGLQMKAAGHDMRKGQECGLKTRTGGHGGIV